MPDKKVEVISSGYAKLYIDDIEVSLTKLKGEEPAEDWVKSVLEYELIGNILLPTTHVKVLLSQFYVYKEREIVATYSPSVHDDSVELKGILSLNEDESLMIEIQYSLTFAQLTALLRTLGKFGYKIIFLTWFVPSRSEPFLEALDKAEVVTFAFLRDIARVIIGGYSVRKTYWSKYHRKYTIEFLYELIDYPNLFKQFDVTAEEFLGFANNKLKDLLKEPEYAEKITIIAAHLKKGG